MALKEMMKKMSLELQENGEEEKDESRREELTAIIRYRDEFAR